MRSRAVRHGWPLLPTSRLLSQAIPGAIRYVAPGGQGSGDGSSWDDAAPLANINISIAQAGPAGVVALATHLGNYTQTSSITLNAAGIAGYPVVITGMDADGLLSPANIVGNRTPWSRPADESGRVDSSAFGGNALFIAGAGIGNLAFMNLRAERVGRIIDFSGVAAKGFLFEDIEGFNVRDGFYTNNLSAITDLTMRRVKGTGFSKKFVRFHGECRDWVIEDYSFDSAWQDKDNFAVGIECNNNARGLIVRRGSAGNAHSTLGTYFNGDGMSSERTNRDILVEDSIFFGCTDGGLDLKSEDTEIRRVTARDNKRNFRIWGGVKGGAGYTKPIRMVDCVSEDPHGRGGGSVHHLWLKGHDLVAQGGSVDVLGFTATGGDAGMAALEIEGQNGTMAFIDAPDIILPVGTVMHNSLEAGSVITGIPDEPMAPAQFTAPQWTLTPNNVSGQLVANILSRPGDGGSAITVLQYRLDGGAWVTMAGTGTGPRVLSGLTNDVEYAGQVRAGNAAGFGEPSDIKLATPVYVAPEIVRLAFDGSALNPGDTPVDTAVGAPAMVLRGTAAVVAGGIQFGGQNNYIEFPNREGFTFDGLFTIKIRVTKANWNRNGEDFIFTFWNTSGNQRAWMISTKPDNKLYARFCPNAGGSGNIVDTVANGSAPSPIPAGQRELMMDRDADGYIRMYVDGVMVGKTAAPVVGPNVNNGTNFARVSGSTTGNSDPGPSILHVLEIRKGEALCGSDAGYTP